MASEVLAQKSSFTSAAGAKESLEDEHENENTNQMQESPQKQQEPAPEQDHQSPADSPEAAAPSSPEYVEHVDVPVEEDPMEMEDDEEEEAEALADDNKLDDSGLVDLTEDLAVDDDDDYSDSDDAIAPVISRETSDASMMVDVPPQEDEQPTTSVQEVDVPTAKLVVNAARSSRSPLKRVQSGVQSAINMFSKSPVKVTWSASKKKSPVYRSENKPVAENERESMEEAPVSLDGQDLERDSESEPEELPKANEAGKAQVRLLNTAAIGGSLYRSLSSEASGSKTGGTSALSSIVKAKNEARKAKLAEIRNKVSLFLSACC
jgi:hypothetical protein